MPMTLITGLPGAGKSLEAVRMMRDDYPDRKKYASNFTGLAYDFLDVEEFEAVKWQECEPGSVLFIDEAWEFFEARSSHKMPPDVIKALAKHRHYGFDIILVCQGPFQLDAHVRALVDRHLHVIRPFGMKYSIVREFRGIEKEPDSKWAKNNQADTSKRRKFDKSLFKYYQSAEVHTIKRKLPLKMIGAISVLLITVGIVWNLISWGSGFMSDTKNAVISGDGVSTTEKIASNFMPAASARKTFAAVGSPEFEDSYQALRSGYFLGEKAIVEGAPWTANKWAGVSKPVTFPKPRCMLVAELDKCICHSQQGTRMDVDFEMCSYLAKNGWFDPSINDADQQLVVAQQQDQLRLAEQYGLQQARQAAAKVPVVRGPSTTIPYILERLKNDRYTRD